MNKIAVLGAGLAGVEIARRLNGLGRDSIVLEKEAQMGGLCRTNKSGDHYWDFGVHALYSRSAQIMDYLQSLPIDYYHHTRNAKIFHTDYHNKKILLDYPFEVGIKDMPLKEKLQCFSGYLFAAFKKTAYSNLQEWIGTSLGGPIAKYFMIPYNNKIWNCPLDKISPELVTSKIEPMSVRDFVLNLLGRRKIGRQHQSRFIYPKKGIQELIDRTGSGMRDKILLGSCIKRLHKENGRWIITTESGVNIQAEVIVSTIPLVELLTKVDIEGINKSYDEFAWNDTFLRL